MNAEAPPAADPRAPELPFDPERELDVARIMASIRDQTRRNRERGLFTDEELEELAGERFRAFADKAYIDPLLLERFLRPGHDWNIATDYLIRTHRTGLAAHISVITRRIIRPLVRLYTDGLLDRQAQINQYFCHLLHNAIREIVRLEVKVAGLEARGERTESERAASRPRAD